MISQPNSRRGRGRKIVQTPVARLASEAGLPLTQPARIEEAVEDIARQDALVVAAYGQILRSDTLFAAEHGAWNVHASLLPKYRGAAPVERAIMAGETKTGATIIKMNEGLDTGDIAVQRETLLKPDATGGELRSLIAKIGAEAIVEVLSLLQSNGIKLREQDEQYATYAAKITSVERVVNWSESKVRVRNLIRSLAPDIGARTFHPGVDGPIKLWSATDFEGGNLNLAAGEISAGNGNIIVGCGDGMLSLERLQMPGSRSLDAREFLLGRQLKGAFRF